jgi:hypothetical protein
MRRIVRCGHESYEGSLKDEGKDEKDSKIPA